MPHGGRLACAIAKRTGQRGRGGRVCGWGGGGGARAARVWPRVHRQRERARARVFKPTHTRPVVPPAPRVCRRLPPCITARVLPPRPADRSRNTTALEQEQPAGSTRTQRREGMRSDVPENAEQPSYNFTDFLTELFMPSTSAFLCYNDICHFIDCMCDTFFYPGLRQRNSIKSRKSHGKRTASSAVCAVPSHRACFLKAAVQNHRMALFSACVSACGIAARRGRNVDLAGGGSVGAY